MANVQSLYCIVCIKKLPFCICMFCGPGQTVCRRVVRVEESSVLFSGEGCWHFQWVQFENGRGYQMWTFSFKARSVLYENSTRAAFSASHYSGRGVGSDVWISRSEIAVCMTCLQSLLSRRVSLKRQDQDDWGTSGTLWDNRRGEWSDQGNVRI